MIIILDHVNKTINKRPILQDINLEMHSGMIYGFVGKNGSGKTMLFRAVSGLMSVDTGTIKCDDAVLHKDIKILPNLGLILENSGLYPELTGLRNLQLLAKLNKKIDDARIRETIVKVGLDPDDKRPFRKYSLGMKQRIVLAQALMEKPDIIMLDEPTNAIDEKGVSDIRNIIRDEKERGALVMISSHNKEDISVLADVVYIINEGRISKKGEDNED